MPAPAPGWYNSYVQLAFGWFWPCHGVCLYVYLYIFVSIIVIW
jgi:hypothetical protein